MNPGEPTMPALASINVLNVGGKGPAPFTAMLLADHGATIVRPPGHRDDTNSPGLRQLRSGRKRRFVRYASTAVSDVDDNMLACPNLRWPGHRGQRAASYEEKEEHT